MEETRENLTPSAAGALRYARYVASAYHTTTTVDPQHLLEGLIHIEDGTAACLLVRLKVDLAELVRLLEGSIKRGPCKRVPLSPTLVS